MRSWDRHGGALRCTADGSWPVVYSSAMKGAVKMKRESGFRAIGVVPDRGHLSLPFQPAAADTLFTIFGEPINQRKAGKIGNRTLRIVESIRIPCPKGSIMALPGPPRS